MAKSNSNYNLIVVAHPDDETIFFGGLIQRLKTPCKVICVTDANADGFGEIRFKDFSRALKRLQVKQSARLNLPDIYEKRLNTQFIIDFLKNEPMPSKIFTHGPLGEYGHPHHQDVCYAVHKAYLGHKNIYSVAYNCSPELKINLTKKELKTKHEILANIYGSETKRFINLLPVTFAEGFVRIDQKEISEIYRFFSETKIPNSKFLRTYRWMDWFFKNKSNSTMTRPF